MITPIPCGVNNAFLLSRGNNAVLVDTAVKKDRRKILRACAGKNVRQAGGG